MTSDRIQHPEGTTMTEISDAHTEAKEPPNIENSISCSICKESLPRSQFSKKTVKKGDCICHICRKSITAARCKQAAPTQIKQGRRGESGIKRRPNNWGYCDYVDKVFSMACFADLVRLRVFASAKDVSESMAALQAVKEDKALEDAHQTICLCIGDGSTPRTAVLACYLKPWESVVSIDPMLHEDWNGKQPKQVRGLTGFRGTLQEYMESLQDTQNMQQSSCAHLVILLVHSHARFIGPCGIDHVRGRFGTPKTTLVSLPCCTRFRHTEDLHFAPTLQYDDDCVFSARRTVQIWKYPGEVGPEETEGVEQRVHSSDGTSSSFCQEITVK